MISSTAARRITDSKMLSYGDYINDIEKQIKKAALDGWYGVSYHIPNYREISRDMLDQIVGSYRRCGFHVLVKIDTLDISWDKDY